MVDVCYPDGADWTCAYSVEELETMRGDPLVAEKMDRADALAWSTISALTGYRLSICPIVLRPCAARCSLPTWYVAPVLDSFSGLPGDGAFNPFMRNGGWFNGCGCAGPSACSCTSIHELILPSEVGRIEEVTIDGVILDPAEYRVDDGNRLIRMDGLGWPSCQDFNAEAGTEGSFTVSFFPGVAPNDLTRYAAGVLATEYFLACDGKECRLPTGVTTVTRAGMSMQIEAGSFPGGMTGIPEVDAVIRVYNPYGIKARAKALSPDVPRGRFQTWGA